ncbi:SoxR reducing system RseC family protein [Candidatus Mcinerneyibacteriota bacterium]|nr:SoxR reducing system RseC family protein [Candidatus Mcinerneyibacteriota bacterium]
MMEQKGIVLEVTGTKALLRVYPDEACLHCRLCDAAREIELPVESMPRGVRKGDAVTVSSTMAPSLLIGLVYGLPLIFLLGGYVLGTLLFPHVGESGGVGGAALFFIVSLALVRAAGRRLNHREKILVSPLQKEKSDL